MTTNEYSTFLNDEGEQKWGPRPYDGPDDDEVHLNGPWDLTHHSGDQYLRDPLATTNSHPSIHDNDPRLSTTASYLSWDHYFDHPDTLEGNLSSISRGPSPSPFRDVGFHQMSGFSPELSSSATFQPSFFSRLHLPYPSDRHHHSPFRHESHYSPGANLTTSSYGITEPITEHSLLPIDDVSPTPALSEHAYPADMGAQNSGLTQDSMTAIPGSTTDSSSATVRIGEYSTTYRQVFSGDVEGSTEGSMTGHDPPLPFSVSQNEGEAYPNLQSEVQESYSEIAAPSNAANEDRQVDANLGSFRCRTCGDRFVQKQGRNRHERDKHEPQMICRLCGQYVFSSGRKYLFRRHLEKHHPEDASATDWADVANLADWVPPAGTQSHI